MIERFNLKTHYHYKQTQLEVDILAPDDIHNEIRQKIIPAILELESQDLIDGFYFIMHKKLDLRLSCDCWEDKGDAIGAILRKYRISDDLADYGGVRKDDFKNIDDNNLESNSRLIMAYLTIKDIVEDDEQQKIVDRIPHQWVHYMYNQFGYANLYEAHSCFIAGFFQLTQALQLGQCNESTFTNILEEVKKKADELILSQS